jgi:hypothetical protein
VGIDGYGHGDDDPALKNGEARKHVCRAINGMIVVNLGASEIK